MELKVSNLACTRGEAVLFTGLSFAVRPGQGLFVRGANGSGKSSLLRIMAGLLTPSGGSIEFAGQAIAGDLHDYRRHIAFLGHLDGLKASDTPREALGFLKRLSSRAQARDSSSSGSIAEGAEDGFRPFGRNDENVLSLTGMSPHVDTPIRYLSAGQRRRVALAGVLGSGAALWLLDEPTTALDDTAAAMLYAALARHLAAGGMFVAATHDDPPAMAGATTLVLGGS